MPYRDMAAQPRARLTARQVPGGSRQERNRIVLLLAEWIQQAEAGGELRRNIRRDGNKHAA